MSKLEGYETKGLPWGADSLPPHWEVIALDRILVSLNSGFACGRNQQVGEGLIHLRPMNISAEGKIDLSDCRFIPDSAGDKRLEYDDVLFNNTNSPVWVGKTAWIGTNAQGLAYSNHMTRLKISDLAVSALIARQLDWLRMSGYFVLNCNKHVNQASISGDFLRNRTPILLPPIAEQRRIADKLEVLLGRVDACRARLDRLPALLKRFRQSVLSAATSGKLTQEWRMLNEINSEWEEVRVQDIADQVFDGPFGSHLKTADYTSTGIRVARLENIGWMIFHADKEAYISAAKYKTLARHTLKKEDVVFSSFISEETRVALLPDSWSGKAINKSDCYCVRVNQELCLSKFLMFRLACYSTYRILGEDVHGATRPRINLGQLKNFTFSLPTLPEQQEIVRRVEHLFAFADRIESRLAEARKMVERLTTATLAKAFRGELVTQDPHNEPAVMLLERLKEGGPEQGQKVKVRAGRTAKMYRSSKKNPAMSKSRFDDDVKGKPYLAGLIGGPQYAETAEQLFQRAQLPLVDFYKQLSWEIEQGMIKENGEELEGV